MFPHYDTIYLSGNFYINQVRRPEVIIKARELVKKNLVREPGITDEAFELRVKNREIALFNQ